MSSKHRYNINMYSVVVQAGGKSSRMGLDKSLLPLHGKPMIQIVVEKVAALGDDLIITRNDPLCYENHLARIVSDEFKNVGALAGIHAGINAAKNDLVVVVAVDMPFVSVDLFQYMKSRISPYVDVVIPVSEKGFEPFHAIYRKTSCVKAIENAIHEHKSRIISWFDDVNVLKIDKEEIDHFDPSGLAFYNINTPDDLLFAEQVL